jgi:ATP-dependent protease ClpP protease subunit
LQTGDTRWIGAQSYLMIHEISAGTGGKIGDMKDDVDFYDRICDRVVDIFVSRSGKITKAAFKKKWQRTDWRLLADESLKLGFVDEIR